MIIYIFKKVFFIAVTLIGISFIAFMLLKHIPGDPAYSLVGERADPEIIKKYQEEFGIGTYSGYLKMIFTGNLGYSYYTKEPVWNTFLKKFPNTFRLALAAIFFAIVTGVFFGIIAAIKRNSFMDRLILFGTTFGISLPVFWWGLILIILFSYTFRIFPASGMGRGEWVYIILPAITLGSRSSAYLARVTRASMLEVLNQPYITSARSRGVGKFKLIVKHALRNALIPVVTIAALDFASYLNGAVLTETIFNWDGVGRWAVVAIFKRDYPVILAVVLLGAGIFVFVNLIVDILYQFINPKMRSDVNLK
jgi:ABC-type dipeptide/oligopeptide/nickel transport system permease component